MATRAPDYTLEGESGDRERYLVLAHQGGDPFAFTEIVKDHYSSLFAQAVRRLHDPRAAEDAVQEALLRAFKGLDGFGGDYKLSAWLHRIVDNCCADVAVRRQRDAKLAERFGIYAETSSPAVDEDIADELATASVRYAVASLPAGYREAVVLRDVMEMEYSDLAEHIGITEQNARARVSRARAALRKMVAPTVTVWVVLMRLARRGSGTVTRIGAKLTSHLSSAAGQATASVTQATAAAAAAPPEVLAAPSRLAPAIGTLAATAVAAVASVGIPALVSSSHPAPSAPSPAIAAPAVPVLAGPQPSVSRAGTPGAQVVAAPLGAAASSTTSTTAKASTTTTVAPATTIAVPAVVVPTGGGATLALLTSSSIITDSGGGLTEGPGQLAVGPEAPSTGRLNTKLLLPTASQPCSGAVSVKFIWSSSSTRSFEVNVSATIVGATHRNGAIQYSVVGGATLVGGFGGLAGPLQVHGTVTVPDDGSNGQLGLTLTSGNAATATCTVDPSVLSAATTVAPTTTVVAVSPTSLVLVPTSG